MCPIKIYKELFIRNILVVDNIFMTPYRRESMMKMIDLCPSVEVKGMKKLNRELFNRKVTVPCLKVQSESVRPIIVILKKYLFKVCGLKPIRSVIDEVNIEEKEPIKPSKSREVLLNPKTICRFDDITIEDREKLFQFGVNESALTVTPVQLTYENWSADDVITAILPEGVETAAGYSLVGHIVHLNLREHLLDYKFIIGEVLLEKIKQARTVVNKVDTIDSKFRVFNMEVLAGEPEFVTEVKENGLKFKFDFSSVYWNPRLSTEHERIVKKLNPNNILYDVFAGVGPFSIPAAKKNCYVLANDLNPESFKWLQYNASLNKVQEFIKTYNKDGADFIREEIKQHILGKGGEKTSHIVMNLPAIAVTFLKEFKFLFSSSELEKIKKLPFIHVYCFVKGVGNNKEMARDLVANELNCPNLEAEDEIVFVRNVAPNKDMMRVSFQLTENMILGGKRKLSSNEEKYINSTKILKTN